MQDARRMKQKSESVNRNRVLMRLRLRYAAAYLVEPTAEIGLKTHVFLIGQLVKSGVSAKRRE